MVITPELKQEICNAFNAYSDIIWKAFLGLEVPKRFEYLEVLSDEELKHKIEILQEFFDQL
jgi:hypothetical protein